jgi:hypothetical protein
MEDQEKKAYIALGKKRTLSMVLKEKNNGREQRVSKASHGQTLKPREEERLDKG